MAGRCQLPGRQLIRRPDAQAGKQRTLSLMRNEIDPLDYWISRQNAIALRAHHKPAFGVEILALFSDVTREPLCSRLAFTPNVGTTSVFSALSPERKTAWT
jgi:hypothetical protein